MKDDVIGRWFGRLHRVSGVVAYGLRDRDTSVFSRTWNPQLSEAALNELWLRLADMAHSVLPSGETAPFMRWTFPHHTVSASMRSDGATFFILKPRQPGQSDGDGIERITSEFHALRAGLGTQHQEPQ